MPSTIFFLKYMSKKAEITDITSVIILPQSIIESRQRRIISQLMKCQSTITFYY